MKVSGRKLAAALLVIVALGQIPLSFIGLSVLIGFVRDGADHFLLLHHTFGGLGVPSARDGRHEPTVDPREIRRELEDARRRGQKPAVQTRPEGAGETGILEVQPTKIDPAIVEAAEPEGPVMAALPPSLDQDGLPVRRIAGLPAFEPSAEFARRLSALPDLALDYVSVPIRSSGAMGTPAPIKIRLRHTEGARVVVLVGGNATSWQFAGALPEGLAGVLVYAPNAAGEQSVLGLPDAIPVARIDQRKVRLLRIGGAVPQCRLEPTTRLLSKCSDVVVVGGGEPATTLQSVEAELEKLLGLKIATISGARGSAEDRTILVPEEIVDDFVRQQVSDTLERYRRDLAERDRRRDVLSSYVRRWLEDRRATVMDEVAQHPVPAPGAVVPRQPRIIVVSTRAGAVNLPPNWVRKERIETYEDYRWNQLQTVGRVDVKVETREPTVIFASADSNVDWYFEVAENADVLAVYIEGRSAPTVTGLPDEIPLTVRSAVFGDPDAAGHIRNLKPSGRDKRGTRDSRAGLARLIEMYPGSEIVLYERRTMQTVTLTDPLPSQTDDN